MITEAGQTHRVVTRRYIPVFLFICCGALRTLASRYVWFYVCLHGETWLLSLMLQSCKTLFRPFHLPSKFFHLFVHFNICPLLWIHKTQIHHGEKGHYLQGSLALGSWRLGVNLCTQARYTGMIYTLAAERVKIIWEVSEKHITDSVA